MWPRSTVDGELKEVSVVTGSTHPARVRHVDAGAHAVAWVVAILGLFAAAIGAYIVAAPEDGSVTLIDRTWSTGDLVDTWAPWLLAVGGAFAAIGMAASSIVDWRHGASRWLVAGEMLLGVIGVAAVVAGIARFM
jgi:hypothetical protein